MLAGMGRKGKKLYKPALRRWRGGGGNRIIDRSRNTPTTVAWWLLATAIEAREDVEDADNKFGINLTVDKWATIQKEHHQRRWQHSEMQIEMIPHPCRTSG